MCCVGPRAVQPHPPTHVQPAEDHRDSLLQHGPGQAGVESNVGGAGSTLQYCECWLLMFSAKCISGSSTYCNVFLEHFLIR